MTTDRASGISGERERQRPAGIGGLIAWATYDAANSAFYSIIQTFVFAAYFTRQVARDPATGAWQWGLAVGVAGVVVAVGSPLLGATADQNGRRKPWLAVFTLLCVLATAALWFVKPSAASLLPGLVLAGVAMVGVEYALVFYNAMLADLAPPQRIGRWSGWGWGLGYVGGLACLLIAWLVFLRPETPPFGLDKQSAQHIRATFLLTAGWFAVFALPLFLFTPTTRGAGKPLAAAVVAGVRQLRQTAREIRRHTAIVRFLIAHWVYNDGLAALFVFAGVYAAGAFGMDERQVLLFGAALNVASAVGAFAFSWVDDWIGAKKTILIALAGLLVPMSLILLVSSQMWFWILGLVIGCFVGPAQAAGRSLLGRLAPAPLRAQMFGFYAFSGRATAFLAPLLVAWLTRQSGSQRIGMSVILVYLAVAFLLMLRVPGGGGGKAIAESQPTN